MQCVGWYARVVRCALTWRVRVSVCVCFAANCVFALSQASQLFVSGLSVNQLQRSQPGVYFFLKEFFALPLFMADMFLIIRLYAARVQAMPARPV